MRIPILKLRNYLLISIQTEIDDHTAIQFQEDLLSEIHQSGSSGVVIDLTSVEMIDSFIAKVLGDVVSMSDLMGAKVVLTGIQPAVRSEERRVGKECRCRGSTWAEKENRQET